MLPGRSCIGSLTSCYNGARIIIIIIIIIDNSSISSSSSSSSSGGGGGDGGAICWIRVLSYPTQSYMCISKHLSVSEKFLSSLHLPRLLYLAYELMLLLSSFCTQSGGVASERQSK